MFIVVMANYCKYSLLKSLFCLSSDKFLCEKKGFILFYFLLCVCVRGGVWYVWGGLVCVCGGGFRGVCAKLEVVQIANNDTNKKR